MRLSVIPVIILGLLFLASCSVIKRDGGGNSSTTGWAYNDPENGGFERHEGRFQQTGPGLRFIQGGAFTMGRIEQDVMFDWNNVPRRVTIASFYIDETEVRNIDWLEYLHWLKRVYPDSPEKHKEALPDSLVWRSELAFNEPYLENYFRHLAYNEYPVVGVSWLQANNYCKWRTDRVNEMILIESGILSHDISQKGENVFTTETYLNGLYDGVEGEKPMQNLSDEGTRKVKKTDGILLPSYRLPTEAEWEFAALGNIGNSEGELLTDRRIYPWDGIHMRDVSKKSRGQMKANFVRGRGDYMGMAGALNDGYDITAPVDSYEPNEYGLFCMAGNVNEWVNDVYRPKSFWDTEEFQPMRGNVYTNIRKDENGKATRDKYGNIVRDTVANYKNYLDGDYQSRLEDSDDWNSEENLSKTTDDMYSPETASSRISDKTRVIKGGGWKDRAYWLTPGARRYKDEDKSANDLGFRCALTYLGDASVFNKR
jgi:gliding motility-associated lipoprotein GldJ